VPAKDIIVDFSEFDLDRPVAGLDDIRRINPQRFEMEQLTAIVYDNYERRICVGYKDVTNHEFWVRGHMPGMPLMPGVMICEAAAQMCSYFTQKHDLLEGAAMVGFGGMEQVRFRDPVRVGDRLVVMCEQLKVRPRAIIVCRFQAYVRENLVAEGQIKGIPLPVDALTSNQRIN
jgi:3-hydroxyacyl-[acyl-carrier-protein] dehydratase